MKGENMQSDVNLSRRVIETRTGEIVLVGRHAIKKYMLKSITIPQESAKSIFTNEKRMNELINRKGGHKNIAKFINAPADSTRLFFARVTGEELFTFGNNQNLSYRISSE